MYYTGGNVKMRAGEVSIYIHDCNNSYIVVQYCTTLVSKPHFYGLFGINITFLCILSAVKARLVARLISDD